MNYKLFFLLFIISAVSFAQLREFAITSIAPPGDFPPIMRSHPDDGAVIIFSSISGLQFESNNNQINDIKEEEGKYTIFMKPEKTIIKVKKKEFIEQNLPLLSLSAKEVKYFKIESAGDLNPTLISINILTEPAGAKIFIDDVFKGIGTSQQMTSGMHKIKAELEGYTPRDTSFNVNIQNNLLMLQLKKVELVAIQIKSIPDNAQILINNSLVDGVTNKGIFKFPGIYKLKLIKPGYSDLDTAIEVNENKSGIFTFILQKNGGELLLTLIPSDAKILINKVDYSGQIKIELPEERYNVEIKKDGYYDTSMVINIKKGEQLKKVFILKQKKGSLLFTVTPLDAIVELVKDGKIIDSWNGIKKISDLSAGQYKIRCHYNDYSTVEKPITVNENQATVEEITLKKTEQDKSIFADTPIISYPVTSDFNMRVMLGLRLTGNFNSFKYSGAGSSSKGTTFGIGGCFEIPFSNHVSLLTNLGFYDTRGITYSYDNSQYDYQFSETLSLSYISIDPMLKFNFGGLFLDLGPSVCGIVKAKDTYTDNISGSTESGESTPTTLSPKYDFVFGLGYDFSFSNSVFWGIDIYYILPLNNTFDGSESNRISTIKVGTSLKFKI